MKQFCTKSKKSKQSIFRQFLTKICPDVFLSKIRLRHVLGIIILHLCAKNQKKTNEPISRKAGNRRADERKKVNL